MAASVEMLVELLDPSHEPLRYHRGVPDRPDQEEYYRWWPVGRKRDF